MSIFSAAPLVFPAVINDDVKSIRVPRLYRLPLQACILETSPASSMSDKQSAPFPGGHRGGFLRGSV
jgi:hypothetical protein